MPYVPNLYRMYAQSGDEALNIDRGDSIADVATLVHDNYVDQWPSGTLFFVIAQDTGNVVWRARSVVKKSLDVLS